MYEKSENVTVKHSQLLQGKFRGRWPGKSDCVTFSRPAKAKKVISELSSLGEKYRF